MDGFFCLYSFIRGKRFNQTRSYANPDESLRQYTSVRLRYISPDISRAHSLVVYPETKCVSLEEMDVPFGEGEPGTYR